MRTTQLLPLALIGAAVAIPVQVDERDNGIDKRAYVTQSEVVWTTTTLWSTQFVWETDAPSVSAAGFQGDEKPHHASATHKQGHKQGHKSHAKPTPKPYTPPASTPAASTPAAPVPTSTSSSTPPPPPPPSSTSSTPVAPASTPTSAPPPPPSTTSTPSPPPPPPSPSSVYVTPTTSAAPAPVVSSPAAPAPSAANPPSSGGSSSDSSGALDTGDGTPSSPFVGVATFNFYGGNLGSCGQPVYDSDPVVAVGTGYMSKLNGDNSNHNSKCGSTISIRYGGVTKTAKVVDTCPGCPGKYGLDMSPTLFDNFGSQDLGKLTGIKWWFN